MADAWYYDPAGKDRYPIDRPRWCSDEGRPLLVSPQGGISRDEIDSADPTLWRYRASFAAEIDRPISMGEGRTPLVQRDWGRHRPLFKLDWLNPTGSFKDRGTSVMLSYLRHFGIDAVLEDSSGNAGSSIAGYGAAGGMAVKILVPAHASPAKIAQARAHGATVETVEGPREACAAEAIRQSRDIFYAGHNWQPFFLEGTKTQAYEIWEDLGFTAPDNVVVTTGAGSSLLGLAIGFRELLAAGQISHLPRLFAVQPLNCSPVDASFRAGSDAPVDRAVHPTIAEGAAIRSPLRLAPMIEAIRESGGATLAVTEDEIIAALGKSCDAGLFIEPTTATAPAALDRLIADGTITETETTVVILGGGGSKAAATVVELLGRT